jgi:hypothetical protein
MCILSVIDDLVPLSFKPSMTVAEKAAIRRGGPARQGPWCRELVENDALALCFQWFLVLLDRAKSGEVSVHSALWHTGVSVSGALASTSSAFASVAGAGVGAGGGPVRVAGPKAHMATSPPVQPAGPLSDLTKMVVGSVGRVVGWARNVELFGACPLIEYFPYQQERRRPEMVQELLQVMFASWVCLHGLLFPWQHRWHFALDVHLHLAAGRQCGVRRRRCCVRV